MSEGASGSERVRQFAAAVGLLTRLPIWRAIPDSPANFAASVWAYPIVGALVGGIGAGIYAVCWRLGLPPVLAAIWALVGVVLTTGALHEDGLADTADGLGGGSTAERKLAIMRDSRIGSFAALALIAAMAARGGAMAAIGTPVTVAVALVVAGGLSRAAMIVVLLACRPARRDGMAAGLAEVPRAEAALGLGGAALLAFCLVSASTATIALALALGIAVGAAALARRQIGGHTGDILGATAVVVECAVLSLLAR